MTSCSVDTWGTSTGVMVCNLYKTLFSFMVVATVFTFVHTIIDGVAKTDQRRLAVLAVYDSMNDNGGYGGDYKLHARGDSAIPLAAVPVPVHDESRPDPSATRLDVYNALGTVRQDNTAQQQQYQRQFQPQDHDVEYDDGVPDVPLATGVRWASAGTRHTPYSPLHTRFDEQQTGYEAFRPHRTPYDEGGYGYRG